jgi:hypothetical protein
MSRHGMRVVVDLMAKAKARTVTAAGVNQHDGAVIRVRILSLNSSAKRRVLQG